VTNSFRARLFRKAEQRLSSVKCFIRLCSVDYVQFFGARDLAFGGTGDSFGGCAGRKRRRLVSAKQASLVTVHMLENMLNQQLRCIRHRPLQRSREQFPTSRDAPGNRGT
jgi:hypothetical protein